MHDRLKFKFSHTIFRPQVGETDPAAQCLRTRDPDFIDNLQVKEGIKAQAQVIGKKSREDDGFVELGGVEHDSPVPRKTTEYAHGFGP